MRIEIRNADFHPLVMLQMLQMLRGCYKCNVRYAIFFSVSKNRKQCKSLCNICANSVQHDELS